MKGYRHISYNDRLKIEIMHNKLGYSATVIADTLGFHFTNIYKELRRGRVKQLDTELRIVYRYSADFAQRDYDNKAAMKGAPLKIGHDHKLMTHIEDMILNHKYSPGAVLGEIKQKKLQFGASISKTTLYRYIDDDLFINLSNKDLPSGKRSKRPYRKVQRISHTGILNTSIEERPAQVDARQEFGHWEMDTVVGPSHGVSTSLLVLTERKTRGEIVMKLKRRTTKEVTAAIDKLQRRYGASFSQVFKTITVDNGSEFMDTRGIEKGGRTKVYYCHPYSSWERGSNENQNKLIRRFIPKGKSIQSYTNKEIQRIEYWINHYPRKIFNYKSSADMYQFEIAQLSA